MATMLKSMFLFKLMKMLPNKMDSGCGGGQNHLSNNSESGSNICESKSNIRESDFRIDLCYSGGKTSPVKIASAIDTRMRPCL